MISSDFPLFIYLFIEPFKNLLSARQVREFFQCGWPRELQADETKNKIAAMRELYPIVIAAMLWGQQWGRWKLIFTCVNRSTVEGLCKGRSPFWGLMVLLRRLTWCALHSSFAFAAKLHVSHDCRSLLQVGVQQHLPSIDGLRKILCPTFQQVILP